MGESTWQKKKKNENRVKAKDRAYFSSTQKKTYKQEKKPDSKPLF